MIDTLIIVALIAAFAFLAFMMLFGWDRILRFGAHKRLQPGELVTFESYASRSGPATLMSILSLNVEYVIVTDRRLIFTAWILEPLWRSREILLSDISEVLPFSIFPITPLHLTVNGEKIVISPRGRRTSDLIEAIQRGRASRI